MYSIEKIIEQEKNMPNPNKELIDRLETYLRTGTITIKVEDAYIEEENCKKIIK